MFRRAFIAVILAMLAPLLASCESMTLRVDIDSVVHPVSQILYGIFFEDINRAADGGLYAELLQNRSFENRSFPEKKNYDAFQGWMFRFRGSGQGTANVSTVSPLHSNNPTHMRLAIEKPGYKAANFGFPRAPGRAGIPVQNGYVYKGFIFARNVDFTGNITAALTDATGKARSGSAALAIPPGHGWHRLPFTVTADADADAVLCFTFDGTGTVDIDMASLFPPDVYGVNWQGGGLRADLVDALRDLQPRFIRFPGGCVAEGSYFRSNIYRWKDTVGPIEQRKENENTWGYMQSYGLGFHEYFQLCEDLGAEPLPVVSAALVCQVRGNRDLPVIGNELREYIQDVLDLIEYANGDSTTVWGAKRAANGHPEPFHMKYLAIGNENWGSDYFYRYGVIRRAVVEKYPDITCIVSAGPVAEGALIDGSWRTIRQQFPGELVDEHYYMQSDWFLQNTDRYDKYPRGGNSVFLGEYAAHEPAEGGKRPNNLYSALCEAAYLTGLERNSDLVLMSCYAPLLMREGMAQWTPNLIWFDERDVVLTPNYHVQRMFANTLGEDLIASELDGDGLYHVATRTADKLYVKTVNVSAAEVSLNVQISGVADAVGKAVTLSGTPEESNSFQNPGNIIPVESDFEITGGAADTTLPPWSVTIFTVPIDGVKAD